MCLNTDCEAGNFAKGIATNSESRRGIRIASVVTEDSARFGQHKRDSQILPTSDMGRHKKRRLSKRLYWGFIEKQTRYSNYAIAEPEKALLDWIYLTLQGGLTPSLDEIEFKVIDKQKLAKYARKYPGTVQNTLMLSLAFEHFAA